jgi:hypothetical protein
MDRFDGTNNSGILRVKFQNILYYMVTAPFGQAKYPRPLKTKSIFFVSMAADVLLIIKTRSMASLDTVFCVSFENKRQVTPNKVPLRVLPQKQHSEQSLTLLQVHLMIISKQNNCKKDNKMDINFKMKQRRSKICKQVLIHCASGVAVMRGIFLLEEGVLLLNNFQRTSQTLELAIVLWTFWRGM